jgi:hypothetical protein
MVAVFKRSDDIAKAFWLVSAMRAL